jgi:hypothetical protein
LLGLSATAALPFAAQVATASAAGALASLATNPLDLVKLRLQVQRGARAAGAAAAAAAAAVGAEAGAAATGGGPAVPPGGLPFHYRGVVDGLATVIKSEGWAALFRGAGARMAFHAPSTAITMTLFESCKSFFAARLETGS